MLFGKKSILWLVVIISERSCDPAHEFIIFIAKASREGFETPHMWDFTCRRFDSGLLQKITFGWAFGSSRHKINTQFINPPGPVQVTTHGKPTKVFLHTLWKYIDKRTDFGGTNKHRYHMRRQIFFSKNIIDEPFILFGHKCVPSGKQWRPRRNDAFHQGLHCLLQVWKKDPQRKKCNLIWIL